MSRYRRPVFGRHGRKVVAVLCAYEVVALWVPWLPTISEVVKRWPLVGVLILALLGHHWFVEAVEAVAELVEEVVPDGAAR